LSVAVIINPISGGTRPDLAGVRAQVAASVIERHGDRAEIFVTERRGHARELTAAVRGRVRLVLAWGGDGTLNEVASVLAFNDTPLGIIPSGSGNGLATGLGIDPRRPEIAIAAALQAEPRRIDVGELGGRLFVNTAGLGFDAYVSGEFNRTGNVRRGLLTYATIASRSIFNYKPRRYRIATDEGTLDVRAVIVTFGNGTQFGHNARIAPNARLDDGLLDLVVVEESSRLITLLNVPRLFTGTIDRVPGCTIHRTRTALVESDEPMLFHVDGESVEGETSLNVRVHPGALWIAHG
jgi:diacylglycerol kinase (ATP)